MEDDFFQFEAPTEAAPELILGKKKKKKKKKKNDIASSSLHVSAQEPNGNNQATHDHEQHQKITNTAPESAFSALSIDDDKHDADEHFSSTLSEVATKKKKKKKKKLLDLPDPSSEPLNDQLEAPSVEQSSHAPPAEVRRPMTVAEKKKAKKERERLAKEEKARKDKDELDAILAELDGPKSAADHQRTESKSVDTEANSPTSNAKSKNKSKAKKAAVDDDLEALLEELAPSEPKPSESAATSSTTAVDDLLAEFGSTTDLPSTKKKTKKKKKKSAAKADDEGLDGGAKNAAEPKKPKKKESAMVRKVREQRERMFAEEERLRKLEEEENQRIEEEERKRQEEDQKKAEEKARRKAAEKAKRERRRQEGTLLSKAEKEKRRKAEAYKQHLIATGVVPGVLQAEAAEKPAKVVYGSRKKSTKTKEEETEKQTDVLPASQALDAEEIPVDKDNEGEHQKLEPEPVVPAVVEPEIIPDAWDELPDLGKSQAVDGGSKEVGDKACEENGTLALTKGATGENVHTDTSSDSNSSDYEGMSKTEIAMGKRLGAIRKKRTEEKKAALAARSKDLLRSPVICILGHVDTGKTKILDRIRRTNVQDAEAGGITQQIGATYFPIDAVKKEATKLAEGRELIYNVPSLLIIDTPGHESFTNLRSRGSSLCDIAILVVDIMHGLEPQTRESIGLLKMRKTPFVVALNKIDRLYDWKAQSHNCPTRASLEKQPNHVKEEFLRRVKDTKLQFAEIGFNTELYWENIDMRKTVSLVPTSAITGEGMPDLLMLLLSLPQKLLTERLMFCSTLEATVLEVKVIEGLGTTIDIILTGGTISEGNTIMVVGLEGPIVTTIRALLTPHPMREMRVKGQYLHHKKIKAAQGIKISADGLEKAVAGTQVMVVNDPSDEVEMDYVRDEVMKDFQTILKNVDRSGLGVYVQASTLGSLEALLEYLRTSKIPVSGINIGPVHRRDVMKTSAMLERRKEFATILAFDVPVEREARDMAEDLGVRIFTADIIYHLFDQFTAYMDNIRKQRREAANDDVVFPVIAKILPQHIYNKKDPIVVGVDILEGILRVGTPLVVRNGNVWLDVGRVASIELNKKAVMTARKGESVAVKIQHKSTEHIMYGRHFDFQDQLVSKMSRTSIDLLKESFRDDLETEDWRLVVRLKKAFDII